MAILRDIFSDGTDVEFTFVKCIPGKFEGCQLNFKYYLNHEKVYDFVFGWTNITIENYIEVTSSFPLDMLNDFLLNNLYMSFENHLYGLEWEKRKEKNTYRLRLYDSRIDCRLNVTDTEVREFGNELRMEWEKGFINVR
ncbi:hypothetical protein [Paenibacillus sp. An7]|uniref:hypothetical protein n=1 Tax=Paenibacillus sp. An7 TaxID=2689577 RepID=UPI00135AAC2D|nr:hypothetical protein [Paenibacillus sp. An7]